MSDRVFGQQSMLTSQGSMLIGSAYVEPEQAMVGPWPGLASLPRIRDQAAHW